MNKMTGVTMGYVTVADVEGGAAGTTASPYSKLHQLTNAVPVSAGLLMLQKKLLPVLARINLLYIH
jgi:hypothetical protein